MRMDICGILDDALSAFYIVGVCAILLLATFHLVLLLEKPRPCGQGLLVLCALVVGGNVTLPIGVSGHTQARVCHDTTKEYVATAFMLLFRIPRNHALCDPARLAPECTRGPREPYDQGPVQQQENGGS